LLEERLVERQVREDPQQRFLFAGRDELGPVAEARRQRIGDIEEIGLCGSSHNESTAESAGESG
jgi:hypothetical protein